MAVKNVRMRIISLNLLVLTNHQIATECVRISGEFEYLMAVTKYSFLFSVNRLLEADSNNFDPLYLEVLNLIALIEWKEVKKR